MEYETGKFKRDTTNRNGKPTKTVRVTGLSVNSKFKDNEIIFILSKEELNQLQQQASTNNDKVKDLESQLSKANTKIETLENLTPEPIPEPTPENPKYYQELITAKDEINTLNQTINNRNELLLSTQDKLRDLMEELTTEITKLYDNTITEANTTTVRNITVLTNTIKDTYQAIADYNEELETQKQLHNEKIDNSNIFTRAFSKDSLKLQLDNSKLAKLENKLKDINDNCITYEDIVKPIEIPANKINEIKVNAKSNKFDIKELYIDTGNQDDKEETLVITPEANDNGNQN